jgi:cytoskeleton protein RodZ
VSLLERIKAPFTDTAGDDPVEPWGVADAIGTALRERREELGLDLDAVGEALRIKPIYLSALEQGRSDDLPGPTYAIGFIRAYAQLLNLDTDRILDSYKAECADVHQRPDLALPVPLDARSLPRGPILLVGLILAACGYGTWYYLSTGERSRPERVAAVPADLQRAAKGAAAASGNPVPALTSGGARLSAELPLLASGPGLMAPQSSATAFGAPVPDPPASPTVPASTGPAAAAAPPASGTTARDAPPGRPDTPAAPAGDPAAKPDGHIDIRALADCWIQVRSGEDQSIVFSRVLKSGETYRVPRPGLVLRTGNAGALALVVDGKPAPSIGAIGTLRRDVALDPQALLAGTAVRG